MAEVAKRKFSYEGELYYDVGDEGISEAHWGIGYQYEIDQFLLYELFGRESTHGEMEGKKVRITLEEI